MNIPIFVINLERSADRMRDIAQRLDALGLSYERFPACDGRKVEREFIARNYPSFLESYDEGSENLPGIGCSVSHIGASKLILERGLDAACIMEDDAEFDDDFPRFVDTGTKYPEWADTIKLEARVNRKLVACCHIGTVAGRQLAYVPGNNTNGAACYIMTKAGARKVADILGNRPYSGWDHTLFEYTTSTVKALHVLPYPARQLRQMSLPGTISPVSTMPKKKVRKTMGQVLKIRVEGTRRFFSALLTASEVIGARAMLLTLSRVQTKELRLRP